MRGILLVRIVEARLADGAVILGQQGQLPYSLIDFDKNEFVGEATGGTAQNPKWTQRANFDVSREAEVLLSLLQRVTVSQKSE